MFQAPFIKTQLEVVPHSLWAVPKHLVLLWAEAFGNMVTFESQEVSPGSRIRLSN